MTKNRIYFLHQPYNLLLYQPQTGIYLKCLCLTIGLNKRSLCMCAVLSVCSNLKRKDAGCFNIFWSSKRGKSICESWERGEEETDGLHYVSQQESVVRYCVVQESRKTPAECFCRAVADFLHRYADWIVFSWCVCSLIECFSHMGSYCLLLCLFLYECRCIVVAQSNNVLKRFYQP